MDGELKNAIALLLGVPIRKINPVSGGDIAQAFLLETATDRLFCKIHHSEHAIEMFRAEKNGLEAIARSGILSTPAVFHCEQLQGASILVLEFIESRQASQNEMRAFGEGLAVLHSLQQDSFGWENSNYIGSLPQSNNTNLSWASFYWSERLKPQLKMAADAGLLHAREIPGHGAIITVLQELFEGIRPSLLHGDLWNGNYLIAHTGKAVLIDPAVYRGDAEVDLAMSRLFGGFGQAFYQGYHGVRPQRTGAAEREQIYQLYYLLVHLNLFGRSYHGSVINILNHFFVR